MHVDKEKQLQGLIKSYMVYAQGLGISEKEILNMIYFAARERGDRFKCLNCIYSRAHKSINEKKVEKEGRISIYARQCVFGIFYREDCPVQVPIIERKNDEASAQTKQEGK